MLGVLFPSCVRLDNEREREREREAVAMGCVGQNQHAKRGEDV